MAKSLDDLLPTAKEVMTKIALKEAEKASEHMRRLAAAEAEKKALIEQLSKPSGLSPRSAQFSRISTNGK